MHYVQDATSMYDADASMSGSVGYEADTEPGLQESANTVPRLSPAQGHKSTTCRYSHSAELTLTCRERINTN